jgi:CPA1 family monovalent cation:H+ antiporter
MAGVLTLPLALPDGSPFPGRQLAILLATAVIVISLLLASVALPPLLRGLEVPAETSAEQEEDLARHAAIEAAVEAVERAGRERPADADAELHANACGMVVNLYRNRLRNIQLGEGSGGPDVHAARRAERDYRLTALRAERDTILRLGRRHEISDEIARKLLREIDLVEARYRS